MNENVKSPLEASSSDEEEQLKVKKSMHEHLKKAREAKLRKKQELEKTGLKYCYGLRKAKNEILNDFLEFEEYKKSKRKRKPRTTRKAPKRTPKRRPPTPPPSSESDEQSISEIVESEEEPYEQPYKQPVIHNVNPNPWDQPYQQDLPSFDNNGISNFMIV